MTVRAMRKNANELRESSRDSSGVGTPASAAVLSPSSRNPSDHLPSSWAARFSRTRSSMYSPTAGGSNRLSVTPSLHENRADRITLRVIRHAASYILAFLVTWTPIQVYVTWGTYYSDLRSIPMCGLAFFASMGMVHYFVWSYNERDTRKEREWSTGGGHHSGHRSQEASGGGGLSGRAGGPQLLSGPASSSTSTIVDTAHAESMNQVKA
ncbi:hypothetical protein BJ684DRAFT_18836 [Piptocephalis cylindrospora]|uniref:Uncharacterized protein n=1 Tax=Piptocephalis cylindrospora TaxID=1907219 RepID=A0A4P9Y7L8_9FUNG|nr:hypothetical protein BJ684DRAFT_18836 [Piptocephalis cylindrospora]|eukprot:RKP14792.1 hypothetical protein BJ684DRAFT_18836 [Piptocephalis cylindrospora]